MEYKEAIEYLSSLNKFGIMLGLERITRLLDLMGRPQEAYRTIHVTGTNGKGSTTAMLAAVLGAASIRTGMYTSPHLCEYPERMMVNGQPISQENFAAAVSGVIPFIEQLISEGIEHPTQFEVLTAAAFACFRNAGVEYAVIEVGLGGLLDSTNVITPEVSVITNVTLEHTDRCGSTVEEIAVHKAGIIKPGVPVVTAAQSGALGVISTAAQAAGSDLYLDGRDFAAIAGGVRGYQQRIRYQETAEPEREMDLALLGEHQAANAALAIRAARLLGKKDARIGWAAIEQGLAKVAWPARFEIVGREPLTIVDGAHNPDGARVLRAALDRYLPSRPIVFLMGVLADKDIAGILKNLVRSTDRVITVRPDSERAEEAAALAAIIGSQAQAASDLADGLAKARAATGENGVLCVTGSLYMVGHVRQLIRSGQL